MRNIEACFSAKILMGIIEDFEPLTSKSINDLMQILRTRFSGIFSDQEIWLIDELLRFKDVGEVVNPVVRKAVDQILDKVKLTQETIQCLVKIASQQHYP